MSKLKIAGNKLLPNLIVAKCETHGNEDFDPNDENQDGTMFLSDSYKQKGQVTITFNNWEKALTLKLPPCYTDYYHRLASDNHEVQARFDTATYQQNRKNPELYPLIVMSSPNLHSFIPPTVQLTGNSIIDDFLKKWNARLDLCREIVDLTTILMNDHYYTLQTKHWQDSSLLFTLVNRIRHFERAFIEVPIPACFTMLLIVIKVAKYLHRQMNRAEETKYGFQSLVKALEKHYYNYLDAEQWEVMMSSCRKEVWMRFKQLGGYQQTYVDFKLKTKDQADKSFLIKDGIHQLGHEMNELDNHLYDFSLDEVHFEVLPMREDIGPTGFYTFLYKYCQMRALKFRLCNHYRIFIPNKVYDDQIVIEVFKQMRKKGLFQLNDQNYYHRFVLLALFIKDAHSANLKSRIKNLLKGLPYNINEQVLQNKVDDYKKELDRMYLNQPEEGDVAERMVYTFNKMYVEQFLLDKLAADTIGGKDWQTKPIGYWGFQLKRCQLWFKDRLFVWSKRWKKQK